MSDFEGTTGAVDGSCNAPTMKPNYKITRRAAFEDLLKINVRGSRE